MQPSFETSFATALLDPEQPVPAGILAHNAAITTQRFAVYSFRSLSFIDVRVAQTDGGAGHPQQIGKIEMTLYLDHISNPNL